MAKLVKAPTPNRRLSANDGKLYTFNAECLCVLPDDVAKTLPKTYKIVKEVEATPEVVKATLKKDETNEVVGATVKVEKAKEKGKLPKSKKKNS